MNIVNIKPQNTVASRLRFAMARRGFNQSDVIEAAGRLGVRIGSSAISQYTTGKFVPKHEKLRVLAQVLGVSQSWLLCETDDMTEEKGETNEEEELLSVFRKLNHRQQKKALNIIKLIKKGTI